MALFVAGFLPAAFFGERLASLSRLGGGLAHGLLGGCHILGSSFFRAPSTCRAEIALPRAPKRGKLPEMIRRHRPVACAAGPKTIRPRAVYRCRLDRRSSFRAFRGHRLSLSERTLKRFCCSCVKTSYRKIPQLSRVFRPTQRASRVCSQRDGIASRAGRRARRGQCAGGASRDTRIGSLRGTSDRVPEHVVTCHELQKPPDFGRKTPAFRPDSSWRAGPWKRTFRQL